MQKKDNNDILNEDLTDDNIDDYEEQSEPESQYDIPENVQEVPRRLKKNNKIKNHSRLPEEPDPLFDDYEEYSQTEEDFISEEDYEPEPKEIREMPRKRKKKKKRKRSRLPGVIILTTFVFALSICLSLVIIAFGRDMLGIGKSDSTHLIVIPEGATTVDISELLKDEGIIKSPECFQLFSRLRKSDSSYIAGEHFVRPNMAYETIINELTSIEEAEQQETVEVTFPEGCTISEAGYILEENHVCSADDFVFYFNSAGLGFSFENRLPTDTSLKFYKMEGYLFPDTYFFYENMSPEQVCQKIYLNFDNKMTPERYAKMESLGLSLDELITFASVVQKEAASTDTMLYVASVFWNRLRNPGYFPLLQSDPTSNYSQFVSSKMDVYDKTIVDSYDTYKSPGLPPGAICNPGIEAIDAVLENVESNYYFFIANIYTGQTYFSETLEEHEAYQEMVDGQVDEYLIASREAEREAEQKAKEEAESEAQNATT
ncbi:MAG: endolytic transglycosylase MltG [Ruminococcus sp.]|nr:endolytic transglycosylase MltG [Ruminococcus sp.]